MITSSKYIAVQTARKDFAEKMNFSGSISSVDTETKLLSWINTNISTTGFSSYSAAESEFYSIKSDYDAVIHENILFWKNLQLSSNPGIALGNLTEVEYETQSADPCGCYDDYMFSTNAIHSQWAESMANLNAGTDFSDFDSMDLFVDARNDMALCRDLALITAADTYLLCLIYCH